MTLRYALRSTQGNRRVALDAGHGYRADLALYEGARGHNLQEDVWVLNFAERLGHYLRA